MYRDKVLELSSQGLMQHEIASKLSCSQKTISNDLTFLKKDEDNSIKQRRDQLSFEHRQVMSNFYQLRKEAWKHFQRMADEKVKVALYNVLQSINDVILGAVAVSDIIEAELLDRSKQQAELCARI
jgi:orotate phosphoribosyltransferase-like protein